MDTAHRCTRATPATRVPWSRGSWRMYNAPITRAPMKGRACGTWGCAQTRARAHHRAQRVGGTIEEISITKWMLVLARL